MAQLAAFRDPAGARADHAMAIRYKAQEYLWLDNKASAGGNPWLNPYAAEAVQYIGDLIDEVHGMGFDQVRAEECPVPVFYQLASRTTAAPTGWTAPGS